MRKYMKWVKADGEMCPPVYRCSNCNSVIYLDDESQDPPCYCKFCDAECEAREG